MIACPKAVGFRPRLVLAQTHPEYTGLALRSFRRLGWDVHLAISGQDTRRLVRRLNPAVIVLGIDLPDESGWLTCEKLAQENPGLAVILVAGHQTPFHSDFATFVGATALVNEGDGVAALIEEVRGVLALSAAG
jgi:DNA-binding NarL/FixJ family response regulator